MLTQLNQAPTETFVARLVRLYHHWLSLCLRRGSVRLRTEPPVIAHNATIAVADAIGSPTSDPKAAFWDHTTSQHMHTWSPARPALRQSAVGHLTYPGGSAPRLALGAQAPAHLRERG